MEPDGELRALRAQEGIRLPQTGEGRRLIPESAIEKALDYLRSSAEEAAQLAPT
jgi:hypothetical protein